MQIETLAVGPLQVNCFIVACEKNREALVVDPGDEAERILKRLHASGLQLKLVVNTHGHFDHVGGNRLLVEESGAELLIHQDDLPVLRRAREHATLYGMSVTPSPEPSRLLAGGEILAVGELRLQVLHTPGHSPGGICLLGDGHLFSGDTLFAGSVGRTDLPGGDHDTLIEGIRRQLLVLSDETVVHPGHGPDTTIGREKRANPYLN
jgi:glyoxylase-like metal-dependent hydrolase (beta-lactamase superfamily II)